MDVANDQTYRCAKSQCEILCVLGYTENDECVDLSIVHRAHFNTIKLVEFCYFYVA
jgi:hypothetical protein